MYPRYLLSLFLIFTWSVSFTQVIINEISYNPPEAGTDSLEYIEIYNAGVTTVDITGWYFLAGVEDTFPAIQLNPGDYFVTAVNAQAMMNVYGINVHQWSGDALNNSGEPLRLADSGGNLMDEVIYDDTDPWPSEPDGNGPSLELISPDLDNSDGANWQFSGGNTGVIINGFEVSGTPGEENAGGTPGPDLNIELSGFSFTPNIAVIKVGDVVRWVNNSPIIHNVNGQQSIFPGNPASFFSGSPIGGPWGFEFEFLLPGIYHYQCDVHAGMGMTGTIYVYDPVTTNDFPLEVLRLVDANGSALFDGVPTSVTGVVHGINFQPTGYSFYVIDQNNVGINVFDFDPGGYVVTEGDLLTVTGVIDQFNGQLEIIPDAIEILSTGNSLTDAAEVTEISEELEASHLVIFPFSIDSIVQTGTTGFNVYVTHENDTKILIRVDADTGMDIDDIHGNSVRGIGTQFDSNFPFTEGYQILALEFLFVDGLPVLDKADISMNPNPSSDIIQLNCEDIISFIDVYNLDGKRLIQVPVNTTEFQLDISRLPIGLYSVKAITERGIWTSLLSVQR